VGIPASSIRVEASSLSTRENAERSAPLLRALGARRVLLVTDRLHMRRASAAFAHFGFDVSRASVPIYEGHPDNVSMLLAGAREAVAIAYYRARGWLRPDAAKEANTVTGSGPPRADLKNPAGPVVVFGASYAAGWRLASIAGAPVLNRGVSGQQTRDMLQRFDRDVVAASPRAVVIWGFINDISNSGPDIEETLRGTRRNYEEMIARARAAGIDPIVATEVTMRPPGGWIETIASWAGAVTGKRSFQDRVNARVIETNAWLEREAARAGLLTLDFHAVLSENNGRRRAEFAQQDGSHITDAGYTALTNYAMPILERHVSQREAR
jgi:lysophospholipase L1-like esterase